MMKSARAAALAALAALSLGACSLVEPPQTIDGHDPGTTLSLPQTTAAIPKNEVSHSYVVGLYPGLDENYNPHPTLTKQEHNEILQLDDYCTLKARELMGRWQEMSDQGVAYGVLEGGLGAIGYLWGFGSMIDPAQYLKAIGLTAAGGGIANGLISFEKASKAVQGYCMTIEIYKADEIEHKLTRVFAIPTITGDAPLPPTSDAPAPTFQIVPAPASPLESSRPHSRPHSKRLPPPPLP